MSNDAGAGAVPAVRLPPCGHPQELLRRDQRGRAGDVGRRHRRRRVHRAACDRSRSRSRGRRSSRACADGQRRGARHRDVVRRDRRCGRRRGNRRAVVGRVQPDRPPRPLRWRGARDRQPRPPRAADPGRGRGARRGGRRWGRHRRGWGHRWSWPDRLAARRRVGGQGAGLGVGCAVRRGQPPRGPPLRRAARGARPRIPAPHAAGVRRAHDGGARRGARGLQGAWCHGRRCRRGGLRQGGPVPRPRVPGWARDRPRRR